VVVVVSAASGEDEASLSWVTRYASGTSSMRRKSRHEELRKLALGSEALYGGITGSSDILTGWIGGEKGGDLWWFVGGEGGL
jgi:hypothetical protein